MSWILGPKPKFLNEWAKKPKFLKEGSQANTSSFHSRSWRPGCFSWSTSFSLLPAFFQCCAIDVSPHLCVAGRLTLLRVPQCGHRRMSFLRD